MRSVAIGGTLLLLLLLLTYAAHAVPRRSLAAGTSPGSFDPREAAHGPAPHPDGGAPSAGAAGLVFDPPEVDLGTVAFDEARAVDVAWRHTGTGTARVLRVDPGCGCLGVEGLPESLAEGASGRLVVRSRGRTRAGPFAVVVHVALEGALEPEASFRVRGFVGTGVYVDPLAIHLGSLSPGREVSRSLSVRLPPPRDAVGTSPPSLEVEAHVVGVEGRAEVVAAGDGGLGVDVLVAVRTPPGPGELRGYVEVLVRDAAVIRVPVTARVVGPASRGPPMPSPPPRLR